MMACGQQLHNCIPVLILFNENLATVLCKSNESKIRRIALLFSTLQQNSKDFRTQRFVDEIFVKYHGFYCSY